MSYRPFAAGLAHLPPDAADNGVRVSRPGGYGRCQLTRGRWRTGPHIAVHAVVACANESGLNGLVPVAVNS